MSSIEKELRRAARITKDGVTVRQGNRAGGQVSRIWGAQMLREVASKTNDTAGDGTTTADRAWRRRSCAKGAKIGCRRDEPDGPQARHRDCCNGGGQGP